MEARGYSGAAENVADLLHGLSSRTLSSPGSYPDELSTAALTKQSVGEMTLEF